MKLFFQISALFCLLAMDNPCKAAIAPITSAAPDKHCVYISSYHNGYEWSDGIRDALFASLANECTITPFYMDTKRNKSSRFAKAKAKQAIELITTVNPDVVITSDDNAAKFVVSPYLINSPLPVVFCGIDWSAASYGFPADNITGMIEITPIKLLFELAAGVSKGKRGLFIADDTVTEIKNFAHFQRYARKNNFTLDNALVDSANEWKEYYQKAQESYDFIILGHKSSLTDWDHDDIIAFQKKNSTIPVLVPYSWLLPYAMIGITIQPEEHGSWAGDAVKAILHGRPVNEIAITTNHSWNKWINTSLLKTAHIKVPLPLFQRARRFTQ